MALSTSEALVRHAFAAGPRYRRLAEWAAGRKPQIEAVVDRVYLAYDEARKTPKDKLNEVTWQLQEELDHFNDPNGVQTTDHAKDLAERARSLIERLDTVGPNVADPKAHRAFDKTRSDLLEGLNEVEAWEDMHKNHIFSTLKSALVNLAVLNKTEVGGLEPLRKGSKQKARAYSDIVGEIRKDTKLVAAAIPRDNSDNLETKWAEYVAETVERINAKLPFKQPDEDEIDIDDAHVAFNLAQVWLSTHMRERFGDLNHERLMLRKGGWDAEPATVAAILARYEGVSPKLEREWTWLKHQYDEAVGRGKPVAPKAPAVKAPPPAPPRTHFTPVELRDVLLEVEEGHPMSEDWQHEVFDLARDAGYVIGQSDGRSKLTSKGKNFLQAAYEEARRVAGTDARVTPSEFSDKGVLDRVGVPDLRDAFLREVEHRATSYRALFKGMSLADFADWYRLRFQKRQPWPTFRPGDDPTILQLAWAQEAKDRGASINLGEGSATYVRAAEELAERARSAIVHPKTAKEKAIISLLARVANIRAWRDALQGPARHLAAGIQLPSEADVAKWTHRTTTDVEEMLAAIEEEYAEALAAVAKRTARSTPDAAPHGPDAPFRAVALSQVAAGTPPTPQALPRSVFLRAIQAHFQAYSEGAREWVRASRATGRSDAALLKDIQPWLDGSGSKDVDGLSLLYTMRAKPPYIEFTHTVALRDLKRGTGWSVPVSARAEGAEAIAAIREALGIGQPAKPPANLAEIRAQGKALGQKHAATVKAKDSQQQAAVETEATRWFESLSEDARKPAQNAFFAGQKATPADGGTLSPELFSAINKVLAAYGASLTPEGFIQKGAKVLSVRVLFSKNKLQMEGNGKLLATGPMTVDFVEGFVEKFWKWEKAPPSAPALGTGPALTFVDPTFGRVAIYHTPMRGIGVQTLVIWQKGDETRAAAYLDSKEGEWYGSAKPVLGFPITAGFVPELLIARIQLKLPTTHLPRVDVEPNDKDYLPNGYPWGSVSEAQAVADTPTFTDGQVKQRAKGFANAAAAQEIEGRHNEMYRTDEQSDAFRDALPKRQQKIYEAAHGEARSQYFYQHQSKRR